MPPVVLNAQKTDDVRDIVHRAVQALAEGKLVAIPTETVYGLAASALNAAAVDRLSAVKGRKSNHPFTLAIKSADDALDFVPGLPLMARRLARRCWPGPITLVLDDSHPDSVLRQLPESVQQAVAPSGTLGLRVPAHPLVLDVLRLLAGPIVLSSANRTGGPEAVTAAEVVAALGDDVQLVIDDGRCQFAQPSTVVRVSPKKIEILRAGVVSEATLKRLSSYMVVLVCTGNTCRSPMAEILLRKHFADALKCPLDKLADAGVVVASAGVSAYPGGKAAVDAIHAMKERGLDLSCHISQPLGERLVNDADLILTMTRGHRDAVLQQFPGAADRVELLATDRRDIADPLGGTPEDYLQCAAQIDRYLAARLAELDLARLVHGE